MTPDPQARDFRRDFPPPQAAASLYPGKVMHHRMRPKVHRFAYGVFTALLDLTRLGEADRASPLFSVGRFNVLSFRPEDHGPRDGSDLAAYVAGLLAREGVDISGGRVLLLCYPRLFGFVFNPLSVYYAYDRTGLLAGIVYEVRNTFGQHHSYVAPVTAGQASEAGIRQERDKVFYVSPFMDMEQRYRFRILPPGDEVAVRILETDADGPMLAATFHGERRPMRSRTILALVGRMPLMTLKVVAGIHWEALKLWLKGIGIRPRPEPPPPVSSPSRPVARTRVRTRDTIQAVLDRT